MASLGNLQSEVNLWSSVCIRDIVNSCKPCLFFWEEMTLKYLNLPYKSLYTSPNYEWFGAYMWFGNAWYILIISERKSYSI